MAEDGTTLGLCGQQTWVREQRSPHAQRRRAACGPSETDNWLDVLLAARKALADGAPGCTPWFQLDRGADCWQVLTLAERMEMLITVRATHDRRVDDDARFLWSIAEGAPVMAKRRIELPARQQPQTRLKRVGGKRRRIRVTSPPRKARVAAVEIRAIRVPLVLTTVRGRVSRADFNAVYVKETGKAVEPVEWMLLTTHDVATRADVLKVVDAYTRRWRVEEFHRVWKRGLCRVEDTQLRSRDAIIKWATILGTVATRAMRLTQLARTTPDAPASSELSKTEIEALVSLREPKGFKSGEPLTLAQAVRWLADLGGYMGPWNGPPGATVIGRGLHDVLIAARAFEHRDKMR
jgi:hypothetical protein